jgi:hypothetical protein
MEKPEVPLEHTQEEIVEHAHHATEPWIMGVALTAAVLAALAAVTALLAEHHANEAMIKQMRASDHWAWYQAQGIKANIVLAEKDLLPANGPLSKTEAEKEAERHKGKQESIEHKAEEYEQESEAHLATHTPLSFGVTMFQIGIAVGAISVLTKRKMFWYVAIGFGVAGFLMLLLGLWMPPWFAHLLSGPVPPAAAV